MKIYSNQADNYIKNLKNGLGLAALIYGPDSGAVRDFQKKMVAKIIPDSADMAVKELTSEQIKEDPALLLDEVGAMNFFAEKRVIVVKDFAAAIAPVVTEALANIPNDLCIIITADDIGKESKLKSFFEAHKEFPAIICYKEDERSLRVTITEKIRAAGLRVDPDAFEYLTNNLGEDKGITLNELEKIITYLGEEKSLSFEEVTKLLADNSELTLSDIAFAVSNKNPVDLEKSLGRAFAEHISAVAILRALQWHFQRLMSVKTMLASGMAIDAAVKSLRPAIFFRQVDEFKASLRKWDEPRLKRALDALTRLELQAKTGAIDSELATKSTLLRMAA